MRIFLWFFGLVLAIGLFALVAAPVASAQLDDASETAAAAASLGVDAQSPSASACASVFVR
jgi:hypothetical protein